METETRQPLALFKVVTVDYPSWISMAAPLVAWALCILVLITRLKGPDIGLLWKIGLGFTVVGAVILGLRYRAIRLHFLRGVEVPGKIVRLTSFQDIGRVFYSYSYLSEPFQASNYVHFSIRMESLEHQRNVVIVLDPAKPQRALIKNIYFDA